MDRIWLEKSFYTAEILYCAYPYRVLEELYSRGAKDKLDKEEVVAFAAEKDFIEMDYVDDTFPAFEALGYHEPGFFRPTLVDDDAARRDYKEKADKGNPYALAHISEIAVESLLTDQGDTPFYIPTKDEIEKISTTGLNENSYYRELKKKIRKDVDAKAFIQRIWQDFSADEDYNTELTRILSILDLKSHITDERLVLDVSMDELNQANMMVVQCYNHTNLRARRGWEPEKLMMAMNGENPVRNTPRVIVPLSEVAAEQAKEAEGFLNSMGTKVDYDAGFGSYNTVIDGKVKRVKVGRNDPCPCGSGKKYKKCHGRNEGRPISSLRGDGAAYMNTEMLGRGNEEINPQSEVEPWNTIVAFAQESYADVQGEKQELLFGATKEPELFLVLPDCVDYTEYSKSMDKMTAYVERNEDGPDLITILNDMLYGMVSDPHVEKEEVAGTLAMTAYEEDGIISVKLKLKK